MVTTYSFLQSGYMHIKDDEFLGNAIGFKVDEKSEKKIPKLKHDERD
ncbi:MAG: hypothetical protein ACOYWZ_16355 [Bacillota bacterium]